MTVTRYSPRFNLALLRDPITIEAPTALIGSGQPDRKWQAVHEDELAYFEHGSGSEGVMGDQVEAWRTCTFTICARPDLRADMRIRFAGQVWGIQAIVPVGIEGLYQKIFCKVVDV